MCQSCVGRLFSENKTAETNKYTLSTFDSKGVLPDPAAIRTHTHTHLYMYAHVCTFTDLRETTTPVNMMHHGLGGTGVG